MTPFTYVLVLFFTIIICFIASFDRRIRFDRYFLTYLKASIVVGIPFIIWDIWFTSKGVWWFDTQYTLGVLFAGLPLEEIMFFICIPFSCVFTYFCFDKFFKFKGLDGFNNFIVFITVIVCAVVALLYCDRIYTLITAIVTIATVIYLHFIKKEFWITQASLIFGILMLGFFSVNGILTGTGIDSPIVNYNPKDFIGLRMGTIPIEDAVYGYAQFLLVLYFFKRFKNHQDEKKVI